MSEKSSKNSENLTSETAGTTHADRELKVQDFDYNLPVDLIAQRPSENREDARLLVRETNGTLRHRFIRDLADEIPANSLIIVNDSRVIASRLIGRLTTGGQIEIFLLEPESSNTLMSTVWSALGKPARKLRMGTIVHFEGGVFGTLLADPDRKQDPPVLTIEFNLAPHAFHTWLATAGKTPLPPYIARAGANPGQAAIDRERYQTVYAREMGSVAAPTAGLHYSPDLIDRLKQTLAVEFASVTLHVGAGTFLPVKSEDLAEHRMHSEKYMISGKTLEKIISAKAAGRPIIVVGTTSFRCLESFWRSAEKNTQRAQQMTDTWLRTDLFIRPEHYSSRYIPWCASALQTNFHQPKSTLLMLVSTLVGVQEIKNLYLEAIAQRYRFFSFGDSTLLWL